LVRAWIVNVTSNVSYPLIAGGFVYVTSSAGVSDVTGTIAEVASVVAIDAQSGQTVWTANLEGTAAALAYDNGRVFTSDNAGEVAAFDGSTGALAWTASMFGSDMYVFSTVPTAYGGILYTSAAGTGGTLFAYDEQTGASIFQNYSPYTSGGSPPAVSDAGLVVAYACEQTYAYNQQTGTQIWHYSTSCGGGGADVPVLQSGLVYVTDPFGSVILSQSAGVPEGTFSAAWPPAFDGSLGFFAAGSQLSAIDLATGNTAWTFAEAPGVPFSNSPLVAGGYVYAAIENNTLTAFDEYSGTPVWSDTAPMGSGSVGAAFPPAALAAAGDLLVVPEGNELVAYVSAPDAGASTSSSQVDGGCRWTLQDVDEPAAGNEPAAVAIGDFNGDGHPDLAVADFVPYMAGTVSVLLGNGDGSFGPANAYTTGIGTVAVATADLNGDGHLDLVVLSDGESSAAGTWPGTASVFLGNGDGTFQPPVAYPTLADSGALAIADLNGDGKPDLLDGNGLLDGVEVLLGKGDGTFQPGVAYSTGTAATSIADGDLNGDGILDVVVSDGAANVDVLLGNGDGTLQSALAYPSFQESCCDTEPDSVSIAELNGDGKLDIAVANWGGSNVSVLLGNGDGTFEPQVSYATNTVPASLQIADMNGDGKPDLVVADAFASPDVSVLLGNGDGTFQAQRFFPVHNDTGALAVADVNGDGRPDVVATSGANDVGVLIGACTSP
jgi:outer membrane protein assembly factor BamB